jgi:hypothetical protein
LIAVKSIISVFASNTSSSWIYWWLNYCFFCASLCLNLFISSWHQFCLCHCHILTSIQQFRSTDSNSQHL